VPCHLAELRRTKAGQFGIDEAVTLEELEKIVETEKLAEILVSMNDSVSHLPERRLSEDELKKIRNGMSVSAEFEDGNITSIRLTDPAENLAAIGEYDHEKKLIQPRIVFPA
jgi:tRNA pseudouridine55 synthase